MLEQAEIIGFAPTIDADRARPFYNDVLGLDLEHEDEYAIVFRSNRSMIRIQKVREFTPARFTVLGWKVTSIRETVEQLTERGVTFMQIPGMGQEPSGILRFPNGDMVAWFNDPDGNTLSLTEFAP